MYVVRTLEVRVNNIVAAANGPLDNLHATQATGVVALLLSLEEVELVVCTGAKRIALKVGEVVPLAKSLDVVVTERFGGRCSVARVFVEGRQALDEQPPGSLFGLELVGTPGPSNGYIGLLVEVQHGNGLPIVWWRDSGIRAVRNVRYTKRKI